MHSDTPGFTASYRRHLIGETRRAVLAALRTEVDRDATVGDVLDAADALGAGDGLGDLSLADLAEALLDAGDEDDEPTAVAAIDDAPIEVAPAKAKAAAPRAKPQAKAKTKAKTKAKAKPKVKAKPKAKPKPKAKVKAKAKPKPKSKPKPKPKPKTAAKSAKKPSKRGAKKPAVVIDERMSIDQAADYFVPLVRKLGEATMQDLEDATGVGRRKLRFHVGQLVRHEYLARHGMGRGTYYTLA